MHRAGEERVLEDKLPLDPGFATVLLDWKRASEGADSGLVFPSYITGQCYHASPLQQDWIRRAGWCLVACPECAAAPGTRCAGFSMRNRKRLRIGVHKARAARPPRRSTWAASDGTPPPQVRDPVAGAKTPLDVQQRLMRHADIRTTGQYGEVRMDNQRAANSQAIRTILERKSVRYAS